MKFTTIVLLIMFSLFFCAYAQENQANIKYFSLDEGLSQVTINSLLQDKNGYVWIATQDGLNRFDGKNFKHYKHQKKDSTSISGNLTNVLQEDNRTNIWVGTIGNGLSYYNQKLERFYKVKLQYAKDENETISAFTLDNEGNIWVASRLSGLHRLKEIDNNTFSQKNYLPNQSLSALFYDTNENLWVGDFKGNIYNIKPSNKNSADIKPEFKINNRVRSFYNTGAHLLIGCDYGLYVYNFQNKKIDLFNFENTANFSVKFVTSFLKENDSSVWVGTGNGLYLLDWKKMTIIQKIEKSKNNKDGLSNNTVHALLKIDADRILVGTANNLNLLNFKSPFFKNISKDKRGSRLLNDNVIFSILKDETDLWVGTSDGGLNLIRNGTPYYFEKIKNDSVSTFGTVREIVKDHKNQRLWVATTRGLRMLNLKTFNPDDPIFKVFRYNPNDANSINGDFIKGMTLDKNNNIWGATFGYGVFRLELKDNGEANVIRYINNPENKNSIQNNVTMCIRADNKNNIWIGTQGGLTKLYFKNSNYTAPIFTNYNKVSEKKESLSNNIVYDILIDKNDSIWLGTRQGLNLFLGDNSFNSWMEQDQFTNAAVYTIQDDDLGNLWLGTNDGLVKFNTSKRKFTQYKSEDGIQSNEFDIHAKYKDKHGTIYLGGIGGLTYFNPKELENIDQPTTLYFSELRIKDSLIKPSNANGALLTKSIIKSNQLEFKHNQFPFYLHFSSIDFRSYKNVKYGYKLLPTDEDWNMLTDSKIQFLNLPSGDYTLQINGFLRGEEWNQKPLEMQLSILPPWHKTWEAYMVYGLFLISMVLLTMRWRSKGLIRQNESLEATIAQRTLEIQHKNEVLNHQTEKLVELDEAKTRLYSNITHEFRTPLTVILGMTETLKTNVLNKTLESSEKSIDMIRRNGQNLLKLVNDMLDLAKVESGSMEIDWVQIDVIPFVKYLSESFHSLAEAKKINLVVYSEIDALQMDIDVNKMASVISNLLSNAIKFTEPNGKIIIHLSNTELNSNNYLTIKVQDNGLGLSSENKAHLFERFYQVNENNAEQKQGTGIGLSLTKELVDLMKGNITVQSTLGKGSTFTVQIPITNNATPSIEAKVTLESAVSLPLTESSKTFSSAEEATDLPLVLIVEDNEDVAHYLKTCLANKYQTMHAHDGAIGIKMALEHIPDIIISDVMMPNKDGFEVCETLKADERTDHIPIVLLTAKVTTEDRLMGLTHGADAYLAKPFNQAELFTRLDQLILVRKKLIQKLEKTGFTSFLSEREASPQTKFLQEAIKAIHKNLDNVNFGSTHLAKDMRLSESQVYRKLKSIADKSTAIFIRSVRLQKAKELLQTTQKTISEIAYEVGFRDPSWFSRAFKEEFGYPPSDTCK